MSIGISPTERSILDILKTALFDADKELELDVDYRSILTESRMHSVYQFSYSSLKDKAEKDNDFRKLFYQILSNNVCNLDAHRQLHSMMSGAGISYVVLKGMSSAKYYPDPTMRTMGDVDFLVESEDLDKAAKVLEENGIIKKNIKEHGFHWEFKDGNLIWELHWAPPGVPKEGEAGERARSYLNNVIATAEYYDGYMVPSVFHHGMILLLHSASHMTTTGIGLRHFCDWAVFVDQFSNMEFCELFEMPLKDIGIWEFARVLTATAEKYLGITPKEWTAGVDRTTVDMVMEDILSSGNFGCKDDQRNNQAKLIRDNATKTASDRSMIVVLFRNLSNSSRRALPITAKIPILLPIGWIYVGIRHLWRVKKGTKDKIIIKDTIQGAQKRTKVYRRLKLFEIEQ